MRAPLFALLVVIALAVVSPGCIRGGFSTDGSVLPERSGDRGAADRRHEAPRLDARKVLDAARPSDGAPSCPRQSRSGSTYFFCEGTIGYDEAQQRCTLVGAHLAKLESLEEDNWVRSAAVGVFGATLPHLWLGATDRATEGIWLWWDGSPVVYQHFGIGEPNGATIENCLELRLVDADKLKAGDWNDVACDKPIRFVCESP